MKADVEGSVADESPVASDHGAAQQQHAIPHCGPSTQPDDDPLFAEEATPHTPPDVPPRIARHAESLKSAPVLGEPAREHGSRPKRRSKDFDTRSRELNDRAFSTWRKKRRDKLEMVLDEPIHDPEPTKGPPVQSDSARHSRQLPVRRQSREHNRVGGSPPWAKRADTGDLSVPIRHLSEHYQGRFAQQDAGGCFVVRERWDLKATWGSVTLAEGLNIDANEVVSLAGDMTLSHFDPRTAIFLDLETTGLSAKRGAIAFVIGLGWIHGTRFVVERIVLHDPSEEKASLLEALRLLDRAAALVTFNGTTFDLPFLRKRLSAHGLTTHSLDLPHLDLLRVARSRLRNVLPSLKLPNLEAHLLGMRREGDVPGSEAPARFERMRRSGDARPIAPLVEHNGLDIVSMLPLSARLCAQQVQAAPTATQQFRAARSQLAAGDESAAPSFRGALDAGLTGAERRRALEELARSCEKAGDLEEAIAHWKAIAALRDGDPTPFASLSRLLESTGAPLDEALACARRAESLAPWSRKAKERVRELEARTLHSEHPPAAQAIAGARKLDGDSSAFSQARPGPQAITARASSTAVPTQPNADCPLEIDSGPSKSRRHEPR